MSVVTQRTAGLASLRAGGLVVLLALPWLVGMGSAPDPSMMPRLFSWGVLVLLWAGRAELTLEHLYWSLLAASAFNAFIGLSQYLGHIAWLPTWIESAQLGEAYGQLRQRNQFATLMSLGLLVALCAELGPVRSQLWAAARLLLIALLVCALAASASRTGALAWLLVLVYTAVVAGHESRVRLGLAVALVAYLLAMFLLPHPTLLTRFEEVSDCSSRRVLWSNVLHLIAERPGLGWGWGELDYAHFMARYEGERFCELLDNAHNLPLQLAVELGLPLAALILSAAVWWVWRARPWREPVLVRRLAWVMLGLIGLHSLLEYPLWYGPFQLTVVVLVYLLARGPKSAGGVAVMSVRTRDWLLLPLVLVGLLYVAVDYLRISQLYRPLTQRWPGYETQTPDTLADSLWFGDALRFARYTQAPLTAENAAWLYEQGELLLHFSPEPRVVSKLIEAARLLGRRAEAEMYEARFKAAYPQDYARWSQSLGSPAAPED